MATRTPSAQRRNQYHRDWGNYDGLNDMPNGSSNPLDDPAFSALEIGDQAYGTGDSATAVCTATGTAGLGDAVWVYLGGGGPPTPSVRDSHRIVVGLISQGDVAGVSCDYADNGDGVALALAFAALLPGQDIRLRTGTYASVVTLPLPAGSRLLGMGPENTILTGSIAGGGPTLTLAEGASAVDIAIRSGGVHNEVILMAPRSYVNNVATQSAGGAGGGAHLRALLADGIRIQNYRATNTEPSTNRPNAIALGDHTGPVYGGSDILIQNVTATGFGYAIFAASIYDFTFEDITHHDSWLGGVIVRWREVSAASANIAYLIRNVRCSLHAPLMDQFFFAAVHLETDVALGGGVVDSVWMTATGAIDAIAWLAGVHLRVNNNPCTGTKISNVNVVSIDEVGDVRGVEVRTFVIDEAPVVLATVVDAVTVGPGTSSRAVFLETIAGTINRTKISNCNGGITLADANVIESISVMNTGAYTDLGTGSVASANIL